MTHNNEDEDFLDIVPDPTVKQILRKEINEVAFNDEKFNKKLQKTKQTPDHLNIIERPLGLQMRQQNNEYEDYEAELNPYKRDRMYEFLQPEKFKRIAGVTLKKPVFRMTDLYLPPNQKVQRLIDKIFQQKIHGKQTTESQLQGQFDNTEQLQKIYNQWQTKQDYDQFENDGNELTQKDLQEIVVNMGDKKENYFLLMRHEKQSKRIEKSLEMNVKNLPIANPQFLKLLKKKVTQLAQKNRIIEEFESQDDGLVDRNEKITLGAVANRFDKRQQEPRKLFGSLKFPAQKVSVLAEESESRTGDPLSYPIVQEIISLQIKDKHQKSFNQQLIKYYSYSNDDIVNNVHKGPLDTLNRIEYNLANPEFFLPKLHIALERQHDNGNLKGIDYKQQATLFGKQTMNLSQLNKSKISGSLFTGNRQNQFSKPSMMDGSGQQIYPLLEDEQQTIQKRIETQLRNIYKQPLHHSELAVKFDLIRFTLDEQEFASYHRYLFPYYDYFRNPTYVKPVVHKSRKIKPKDLIINSEMKNSNIKYAKQQALSLSEGEFILIQYIQQHPLVMSSVGMCERMFIQINYQEMLSKISQDLIRNAQIDEIQELRDNPNKNNTINNVNNNNFERKCELWRENIKQNFGENGKLFLWEPKMAGKLIGSPEGLGVAVMQSNLATYPIVKKKINPKSRDFLLVREDGKWYLRRIQHVYVSGQIQPKKKIFNPDSRQYTVFKSNYEKAFMRRQISLYGNVNFDFVKRMFAGESEASLKKALKAIRATSNDNKNYTIMEGYDNYEYELTAEDVCLYERMQKSICLLKEVGITQIRNNEKMKNVLKEFNKRHIQSLQRFTISRMIKDQLLLTSWYLTDSFSKFKIKTAKIEIIGMADPTNGRGGYSFINKPQKQRTARQDMDEKTEKPKVSGTTWDLRKLKTKNTREILVSRGHKEEELKGKGRWDLVGMIRKEQNTEYARKERQTKPQKAENQKREISRVFNRMLAYLNGQQASPIFNYNFKRKIRLQELMEKERALWVKTKQRILKGEKEEDEENEEEDEDDFDEEPQDG